MATDAETIMQNDSVDAHEQDIVKEDPVEDDVQIGKDNDNEDEGDVLVEEDEQVMDDDEHVKQDEEENGEEDGEKSEEEDEEEDE